MPEKLPSQLDPARLAARNAELTGSVPLQQFPRLCESLHRCDGDVQARLHFRQLAPGYNCVEGELHTELILVCQRCLAPMSYPISIDLRLAIIETEAEAANLPADYEPVVAAGKTLLHPVDLLEDELLLQLPIVASHADSNDCDPDMVYKASPKRNKGDKAKQEANPFAVLKDLTNKH